MKVWLKVRFLRPECLTFYNEMGAYGKKHRAWFSNSFYLALFLWVFVVPFSMLGENVARAVIIEQITFYSFVSLVLWLMALNCFLIAISVYPDVAAKFARLKDINKALSPIMVGAGWLLILMLARPAAFPVLRDTSILLAIAYSILYWAPVREPDAFLRRSWVGGFSALSVIFGLGYVMFITTSLG